MRRYNPPFNGKQFVLNKNTGEIHDLDKEHTLCRIDDIKTEHVCALDDYQSCLIYAAMFGVHNPNGCAYCMPEKNKG